MSKQSENANVVSDSTSKDERQTGAEKEGTEKRVKRRGVLTRTLAIVLGAGAAGFIGLRGGGAAIENTVDAKADAAFTALTKPLEATAEVVLTDSVNALETAKPFVQQFLHIIQAMQDIGTKDINTILSALEKLPFIHTTALQKLTSAVNTLLAMKENDLLTLLDLLEKSSNSLKQQVIEAEHKGPTAIHAAVSDGVRSIDPVAP